MLGLCMVSGAIGEASAIGDTRGALVRFISAFPFSYSKQVVGGGGDDAEGNYDERFRGEPAFCDPLWVGGGGRPRVNTAGGPAGVIPRKEDGSGEEPTDHERQPCPDIGYPAHKPESWEENATQHHEGEDIPDQRQEPEGHDRIFAPGDEEDGHWGGNDERCEEKG